MSSCDLCARNIDLWFNKSVYVTSFTFRRVRFMSRTVLSDLLGFLVLVFCPCKLQSMIPSFSRASIPSQTVMPCNLTLTILSVGPNHLGSYLISPSVNTSVSPAKNHLYSPPIISTKRLWNLAIQRKTLVCGCQAILPRTNT